MAESTLFTITKLNSENYEVWKYKLSLLLMKEDLWDTVNEDPPTPVAPQWSKKDGQARAMIDLLVEDNQLIHIRQASTAKEAWTSLENYYEKSRLTSKVFLFKKICNLRLSDDGDMEAHIRTMTNMVEKLTALGEKLMDHLIVVMLLSSLPDSYSTLITALESRLKNELTLELVKSKLIDEYRRRKALDMLDGSSDTATRATCGKNQSQQTESSGFFCNKHQKECHKYLQQGFVKIKDKEHTSKAVQENNNENCSSMRTGNCGTSFWYSNIVASQMSRSRTFFNENQDTFKFALDSPMIQYLKTMKRLQ